MSSNFRIRLKFRKISSILFKNVKNGYQEFDHSGTIKQNLAIALNNTSRLLLHFAILLHFVISLLLAANYSPISNSLIRYATMLKPHQLYLQWHRRLV